MLALVSAAGAQFIPEAACQNANDTSAVRLTQCNTSTDVSAQINTALAASKTVCLPCNQTCTILNTLTVKASSAILGCSSSGYGSVLAMPANVNKSMITLSAGIFGQARLAHFRLRRTGKVADAACLGAGNPDGCCTAAGVSQCASHSWSASGIMAQEPNSAPGDYRIDDIFVSNQSYGAYLGSTNYSVISKSTFLGDANDGMYLYSTSSTSNATALQWDLDQVVVQANGRNGLWVNATAASSYYTFGTWKLYAFANKSNGIKLSSSNGATLNDLLVETYNENADGADAFLLTTGGGSGIKVRNTWIAAPHQDCIEIQTGFDVDLENIWCNIPYYTGIAIGTAGQRQPIESKLSNILIKDAGTHGSTDIQKSGVAILGNSDDTLITGIMSGPTAFGTHQKFGLYTNTGRVNLVGGVLSGTGSGSAALGGPGASGVTVRGVRNVPDKN